MKFSYKGRNREGAVVNGIIAAGDRVEAVSLIRDSGITPIVVEKKSGFLEMSIGGGSLFQGVKLAEKILFTKNLSGMLKAGLPLSRALDVLSRQTSNKYFKTIINSVLDTIGKGGTLSEGLAKYPKVFSSLFVSMVKAGEESGGLPGALLEVGSNLEKSYALRRKVKSALMYPSIIICAIIIIGVLMFIYVVPTLTKTFKELNVTLPMSTRIVVGISDLLSNHIMYLLLGVTVLVVGGYFAMKLPSVRRAIDFISVRLPVLGAMIKEMNAARTSRTLASLLTSGVNISRSLSITKEVLQNVYYKKVLEDAEALVQKGEPISKIFKENTKLYPIMVGEMMEVGEETGKMTSMLNDIATFYENEVDAKTKDLSTIIEPVLMVFVGAGVGFFAVSMLSPMYSIMDAIK